MRLFPPFLSSSQYVVAAMNENTSVFIPPDAKSDINGGEGGCEGARVV